MVERVAHSKHPHRAWSKLSRHNKIEFKTATAPTGKGVKVKTKVVLLSSTKTRHCFRVYKYLDWKGPVPVTTFSTWEGVKWCYNDSGTVVLDKLTSQGGQGVLPGWSWHGLVNKSTMGTGGPEDAWVVEEGFYYAFLDWGPFISQVCEQIRVFGHQPQPDILRSCNMG
jgi:hypothetical protein